MKGDDQGGGESESEGEGEGEGEGEATWFYGEKNFFIGASLTDWATYGMLGIVAEGV